MKEDNKLYLINPDVLNFMTITPISDEITIKRTKKGSRINIKSSYKIEDTRVKK